MGNIELEETVIIVSEEVTLVINDGRSCFINDADFYYNEIEIDNDITYDPLS